MRLLQVSLRSLLLYSLLLVLVSIPVSLVSISAILNHEVDETLTMQSEQFLKHVKQFEYLDDLDRDLVVLDQLTYNVHIRPAPGAVPEKIFESVRIYDSLDHEERPYRQLSSVVTIQGKPYRLTILISLVDNHDLLLAIGVVQAMLLIVLAGGLVLINRSLSRRLWKPFYDTLNKLKAYTVDRDETVVTGKTRISEFDDLNKTIAALTERNRKIFLQQKEFIEDASHELQTPLAVFQSQLDVLMQQPGLSETAADAIAGLESTAQRMSRLNKDLLLLSKIDNRQFTHMEDVALDSMVREHVSRLKARMEEAHLTFRDSYDPTTLSTNRALTEVLVTNLLHNAILHTLPGGMITVKVDPLTLVVTNTGKPLQASDRIFDRFRKENNSTRGSGLGLAIVRKICESLGYRVAYAYDHNRHIFTIRFT